MANTNPQKALIAMSGGVDSSVAAFLTQQQGFCCAGATMKLISNEDDNLFGQDKNSLGLSIAQEKSCCSLEDVEDARSVAQALGMPFYVFDFTRDFNVQVIDRFIAAYQRGETPNPCIDCNRYLKFERLLQRAIQLGMDFIVTGHYARIEHDGTRWLLKKALDESKDQSYVLYAMTQDQLARTRLPLGGMHKNEIRTIAQAQGFINAHKRDSQDICFVPGGDYAAFIEQHTGKVDAPGDFLDLQGTVLGQHRGLIRYTVGQRRGLGLSFPQPMYVHSKDALSNSVTLCRNEELFSRSLDAADFNFIACEGLSRPARMKARARYNQTEQWAVAEQTGPNSVHVEFEQPQRAIARGQAVVLYDGDTVLGGGTIQ